MLQLLALIVLVVETAENELADPVVRVKVNQLINENKTFPLGVVHIWSCVKRRKVEFNI